MKTWLITGRSSGFGQRLALAAAQRGDQVIATARDERAIEDIDAWRDITIATDFDQP